MMGKSKKNVAGYQCVRLCPSEMIQISLKGAGAAGAAEAAAVAVEFTL
jgi:hypothetical protein